MIYWVISKKHSSIKQFPHQQDALPGHPPYGQHRPALDAIVVAAVQVSAHPKVGNLDGEASVQHAVPGGQVAVHKVQRLQILHPWRDLDRHVEEVGQTGGWERDEEENMLKGAVIEEACAICYVWLITWRERVHVVSTVTCINLTEGMLLACVRVLSISLCDRNMLRSPFSMYSVTMHSGSDDMHTQSSRMMFGSFRRDMIFISFRKSFLMDGDRKNLTDDSHFSRLWQVSVPQCCFNAGKDLQVGNHLV